MKSKRSQSLELKISILLLGVVGSLFRSGCSSLPDSSRSAEPVTPMLATTSAPASTQTASPTLTLTVTSTATPHPTTTATPDLRVLNPANQHLYLYVKESKTWHAARDYCASRGGHLVTIQVPSENLFVYNISSDNDQRGIWLGASDEAQEGKWEWVTGEPWAYSNWKKEPLQLPDQPDNQHQAQTSGANYLLMIWDKTWYDVTNADYPYFVCEWEPLTT